MLNQVGTVHFARAAILDGDRFLFASHFDGSGEAYLDDFYTLTQGGSLFERSLPLLRRLARAGRS